MFKVMLVEDDVRLATLISEYLTSYEFTVVVVSRGDAAVSTLVLENPDMVILDLMLPGLDGMVVCRLIREVSQIPILILTAREDTFDEVSGLEQGADDYVNKPIKPRVLLARIRALLRRNKYDKTLVEVGTDSIEFGRLQIVKSTRQVLWRGKNIDLSGSEYKLLIVLAENQGKLLSRDDLLKKIRGINFNGLDRSIDNNISRLRRKFEDERAEKIRTLWGEGYILNPLAWD